MRLLLLLPLLRRHAHLLLPRLSLLHPQRPPRPVLPARRNLLLHVQLGKLRVQLLHRLQRPLLHLPPLQRPLLPAER